MIAQGVQMGVQAAIGFQKASSEHSRRRAAHKAAQSARRYAILENLDENEYSTGLSPTLCKLDEQLIIPDLQALPSICELPTAKVYELVSAVTSAQKSLHQAAAATKKAQATAGFKAGVGKIALGGIRGAAPLTTFVALGFKLDAQSCRAALKKMKKAEELLATYWQHMQTMIAALEGVVSFVAPKQPLALTAILHVLEPGSNSDLQSCQHPVIQALRWNLSRRLAIEQSGQASAAQRSKGAGRKGGPFSFIGDGLKYARRSNKGLSEAQIADRGPAIAIAAGACDADLLELHRLAEQTEQLRKWLQGR